MAWDVRLLEQVSRGRTKAKKARALGISRIAMYAKLKRFELG